jgi:hypothetical protein
VGIKHFSRDARMMTDRAAAPYVGNPYYAAAMAQAQTAAGNREAEGPEDDGGKKSAKKKNGGKDAASEGCCPGDLEMRIQRLESSFEMQVQALQRCVEELRALRAADSAYQKSSTSVSPPHGHSTQAGSSVRFRTLQPLSPPRQVVFGDETVRTSYEEAARTSYEEYAPDSAPPQPLPLRRLPTTATP